MRNRKLFDPRTALDRWLAFATVVAVVLVLLTSMLRAQVQIVVENPAPMARTAWVRFTVPEASAAPAGTWKLGPFAAHPGRLVGAGIRAWHAQVSIGSLERAEWTLHQVGIAAEGSGPSTANTNPENAAPPIRVIARVGGVDRVWDPKLTVTADGPAAELHLRGILPGTQFVAELWATVWPGSPVVPWELLVVASDPTTTAVYQDLEELRFEVDGGVVAAPWWPRWRGAEQIAAGVVRLTGATTFGDSQGLAWAGVVALASTPDAGASLYGPVVAVASSAAWAGSWGPFGVVPAVQRDQAGYGARLAAWWNATQTWGDPWRRPRLGLSPNSGDTGAQDDFGSSKLGWAWAGGPTHVLEAMHSALHEASRPGIWYEANGELVQPWRHPDHVTWNGYTHWHPSVSGDRLGKGSSPTPRWSGGYIGPDREHWSNLTLCGAYLLTGSRVLGRVIEKQARQILSGETIDPRLSTSHKGAARGIGRTLLAAAWIDCCLEPAGELRRRMRERIRERLERIIEPETRPPAGAVVQPLAVVEDHRRLGGRPCWSWEEPLGIVGLRAAELRFGLPAARVVLDRALPSWLRYGWWDYGGRMKMADAVAWLEGQAPEPSAYPTPTNPAPVDPPVVEWNTSFSFANWSMGAVFLARDLLSGADRDRALRIIAENPARSVADAEWRAVR